MEQINMQQKVQVEITLEAAAIMLQGLGKLPLEVSGGVWSDLKRQVDLQLAANAAKADTASA